jgi:hypothetical protein
MNVFVRVMIDKLVGTMNTSSTGSTFTVPTDFSRGNEKKINIFPGGSVKSPYRLYAAVEHKAVTPRIRAPYDLLELPRISEYFKTNK